MKIMFFFLSSVAVALVTWTVVENWIPEKNVIIVEIENKHPEIVFLGVNTPKNLFETDSVDGFATFGPRQGGYILTNIRPEAIFYAMGGIHKTTVCVGKGNVLRANIGEKDSCRFAEGSINRFIANAPLMLAALPEKMNVIFNPFYD